MQYSENTVIYRFCDTDETGWDEYDIEGENYHILIDVCSRYCTSVSFDIYPQYENAEYLLQIQKYLIKRDNTYRKVTSKIGSYMTGSDKRYYTVCTEMCDLLKKEKSIFSWFWEEEKQLFHFENLTFYRDDGTVFFEDSFEENFDNWIFASKASDESNSFFTDQLASDGKFSACLKDEYTDNLPGFKTKNMPILRWMLLL